MSEEAGKLRKAGRRNAGRVIPTNAMEEKDSSVELMQFPSDLGTHEFIRNLVRCSLA